MKIKNLIILLLACFLFSSCFKDNDDTVKPASALDIQKFIYRGLNYYYLYKDGSPKLADNAFADDEARDKFLKRFESPEELFDNLTVRQDRFSRLFDDYNVIENALNGVTLNNGMEFGLVYFPDDSGNVFGYVRYVLPNTDAEARGLKRGDLFTTIDGVQLNEDNFNILLSPNTYSIGLATFDGENFQPIGNPVQLNKTQYDENPVFLTQTLNIGGQKIGYLMYNSFTRNYDTQLNDAFGRFKADGVTNLVVDLRYNGGGSVETATDLASMITGQFNGDIFYKEFWNADRQEERARNGLFDNSISNGAATNSLNLSKVYILTASGTASASELIINGLNPYINTVQVGDKTTGKFQASFLLYDGPSPNFSRQQASTRHTYVMLPLVFKTANKVGNTDFNDGLTPNIFIKEDFFNLGQLGNSEEPLLATALNDILGLPRTQNKDFLQLKEISDSSMESPLNGVMISEQE